MNANLEDKVLIQGLIEGNVKIFDYLFLHYYSGLVVYATNLGITQNVAEDIVQDFFLKLWIDRKSLSITNSLKNYLFIAIRNRCYDYFRHQKVEERAKETFVHENNDTIFMERDYTVESDLRERIDKAIAKLPEKCRKIFIMNIFDGVKPIGIAEREGISVRTVEGHIGKAYKLLRKELKLQMPSFVLAVLISKLL